MTLYAIRMFPGNSIRDVRKKAALSQRELGKAVGLSQGQISNIENGDRTVSLDWMRRIAGALQVSVADLLDDRDNPHRLAPLEAALIDKLRAAEPDARWMAETSMDAILCGIERRKTDRAA